MIMDTRSFDRCACCAITFAASQSLLNRREEAYFVLATAVRQPKLSMCWLASSSRQDYTIHGITCSKHQKITHSLYGTPAIIPTALPHTPQSATRPCCVCQQRDKRCHGPYRAVKECLCVRCAGVEEKREIARRGTAV